MNDVRVRPARGGDLAGLLSLYGELADGRSGALPATGPAAARVLGEILADPARRLLVAEADGRLAGTADLTIVTNLTHAGKPWAIIENVVVSAALRGHGIGAVLIEHAMGLARQAGCYKVQLLSRKQRTVAHRFYRRLGLEPVAEGFRRYFGD